MRGRREVQRGDRVLAEFLNRGRLYSENFMRTELLGVALTKYKHQLMQQMV